MKYPQLVSTRAVNAISDWLVSRLEQLGVEAPLIYSRLLLSLLQSSVQLNDPIEFSNLETFLANRKGNSKRYPPCDTDTLKKIAAVQCLMDIVSSEQEITKIENLVDELCEKVNDIEKQSNNIEGDDDLQIAALTLNSVLTTPSSSFNTANGNNNNKTFSTAIETTGKKENIGDSGRSTTTSKLSTEITLPVSTRKTKEQTDAEDPRKRYYRAFPALSKEMEDSIVLLRRNTKSLTWPVDRKINSSNKIATNSTAAATAATSTVAVVNSNKCASLSEKIRNSPSALLGNSQKGDSNTVLCNTAGVKRKTKRRRNQAMLKGKTAAGNNTRKNSYCGGSSSPTWDTDFEGSWEMGRDLIKEFIVKQNNRNRSTSESAAYNMAQGSGGGNNNNNNGARDGGNANEIYEKRMKPMLKDQVKIKQDSMSTKQKTLQQKQYSKQEQKQDNVKGNNNDQMTKLAAETCMVEISLCDDIVDNSRSDDTLASVSDITEGNMNTARRLYERDISNDSLNEKSTHDYHSNNHKQSLSASSSEQLDFAQFKAKFNSSVEALWKNSNSSDNSNNNLSKSVLHSSIITDSSVSVAPYLSENLKNFWTNYYSHHFDVDKFKQLNCNDCCDYSMTTAASLVGNSFHSDVHSDYFSMPTVSSGVDEFDKSVGGKRAGGKTSPIGVFLQNTIWSENSYASYPDTDESFFIKALKSSTCNSQKSHDQFKMDISGGDKSYYYPYQTSKWSEGINGVPHNNNANISLPQNQSNQQPQQPLIITSSSSSSSISTMDHSARSCYTNDLADSTPSSTSSYFGSNANWQIPTGNNLQADVKSWSSSNPTSLAELYGGAGSNNINNNVTLGKKNSSHFDRNAAASGITSSSNASSITLANHSPTCSGFIAYSRIKSYVKLIDSKPIAKWQKPEAEYHHHLSTASDEDDDDDENLLNSERTHFHPIKMSYADGHTFEISSNLDPVDFERSDSGYLYLESEKYLEYIRSDTLSEDDGSVAGHFHRTDSVASRECASSVASSTRSSHSEFVIRFRLRTTDKACQTESNLIIPNVIRSSLVYQMASAHLPRPQKQADHSNSTNDGDEDEDDWMDIGCGSTNIRDEDDYVSMDQWSMAEIGKKCIDNNNSSHTLWGMCPACNNDMKSIPANRLLKAELNMEGDEIMSDLRYMQDLYIGSDWEDQNGAREGGGGDDDDTDLDAETIRDCEFYHAMATPAGCGEIEEEDQQQKDMLYNVNKLIADLLRPENAQTLANALGAVGVGVGLGVGVGVGCLGVVGAAPNQNIFGAEKNDLAVDQLNTMNDEKYIGGLWNSDENIIWKKEFNPIDIFSRLNNNNNDSFLEKLNWEYSNLAEIWGKASPNNTGLTTNKDCPAGLDSISVKTNEEFFNKNKNSNNNSKSVTLEDEESIKIACKNIKNLLKSSSIPPPAAHYKISKDSGEIFEMNESLFNDCKQMQCFLNSNKFKISNRIDRKRRHSASQNVFCNSNNNNFVTNNNNNSNNNNTIYDNNNLKLSPFGSALNPSQSNTVATGTATATAKAAIITTTTQTKATTKDTLSDYGRNILKHNLDDGQQEHGLIQHHNNNNNNNDDDDDDDDDLQQQQHANNSHATIITCKYWTTMHPIINGEGEELSGDDNSFDAQAAAASFFIDKSQFIDGLSSITLNTSSILKHVTLVSRPLTR